MPQRVTGIFTDWRTAFGTALGYCNLLGRPNGKGETVPFPGNPASSTHNSAEYMEIAPLHLHGIQPKAETPEAPFEVAWVDFAGNVSYTHTPDYDGLIPETDRIAMTEHEHIYLESRKLPEGKIAEQI
jgi:hypothetical protein